MQIKDEPLSKLSNKTFLEIGSGAGRTTRDLVTLLSDIPGAKLIVTDKTDHLFDKIRSNLGAIDEAPRFIMTDACELTGIRLDSIDYIVCNLTLCAINSDSGRGTLALAKFLSVLKPGGKLFIEEEFPINAANGPAQQVWSDMWRVMKSAFILAETKTPANEYYPQVLARICEIIGYSDIQWEARVRECGLEWIAYKQHVLREIMPGLPGPRISKIYTDLVNQIRNQAQQTGKIEIPIYVLSATKPRLPTRG